ncbi:hypothetical protein ZIOFF_040521 [Zingiber officinale]|uniref:WW domain-containing protein n=1 Tax=Zingiber officinale TaxID=94328 RepID=A0A8J5G6E0_ZINOF|nr:hypothetical protein ZIOFF_040521 [Zingiber officinale]
MVSFREAIPLEKKRCHKVENFFSKKRKKGDEEESEGSFPKKMKVEKEEEIELSLNVPLPLDWQRCLDIKSGQIHFYNTRTQRRTSTDPRLILDPPTPTPAEAAAASTLSLDLELNLASRDSAPRPKSQRDVSKGPSLSWTSPDADAGAGEMVAAVCARCHMLVMMSKPALSCPNFGLPDNLYLVVIVTEQDDTRLEINVGEDDDLVLLYLLEMQ